MPVDPESTLSASPSPTVPFRTAGAFEAEIRRQLKEAARESGVSAVELHRYVAYDRLLARLMGPGPDGEPTRWVLKGGVSMLARLGPDARHTKDVDIARGGGLADAVAELRSRVSADLGDYFSFQVSEPKADLYHTEGVRLTVAVRLGNQPFENMTIDCVGEASFANVPQFVPALNVLSVPGLAAPDYQIHPLPDFLADKTLTLGQRYGPHLAPSTRYRDLADIVTVANTSVVDAAELVAALEHGRQLRGAEQMQRLEVPGPTWESGYAKVAARVPHLEEHRDLAAAMARANEMLEPILSGRITSGTWHPDTGWQASTDQASRTTAAELGADRKTVPAATAASADMASAAPPHVRKVPVAGASSPRQAPTARL